MFISVINSIFRVVPGDTLLFIRTVRIEALRLYLPNKNTARICSASDESFPRHSSAHVLLAKKSDKAVNTLQRSLLYIQK